MSMKRTLILALAVVFVIGCGEDSDPDSNNDSENTETNNNANNEPNADNQGDPPNYLDDPFDTGYGERMHEVAHLYNDITIAHCECFSRIGHSSEEDCLAEETESASDIDNYSACLDHSMAVHNEEPPEGFEELLSCKSASVNKGSECLSDARSEFSDICHDDGIETIEDCFQNYATEHSECRGAVDEATAIWYGEYTQVARDHDCHDYVQWVN